MSILVFIQLLTAMGDLFNGTFRLRSFMTLPCLTLTRPCTMHCALCTVHCDGRITSTCAGTAALFIPAPLLLPHGLHASVTLACGPSLPSLTPPPHRMPDGVVPPKPRRGVMGAAELAEEAQLPQVFSHHCSAVVPETPHLGGWDLYFKV